MSRLVKNPDSVSAGRGARTRGSLVELSISLIVVFSLALSIGAGPAEATLYEASLLHRICTS